MPYYDEIGGLDLYVVLEWVLYLVHEVYWVIYEICVLWNAMFSWMPMFDLMKVMWMFILVTLKWCLSVGSGIGNYPSIAPSVIRGLLRYTGLTVKDE